MDSCVCRDHVAAAARRRIRVCGGGFARDAASANPVDEPPFDRTPETPTCTDREIHMRNTLTLAAVAVLAALGLTACGGGDDASGSSTTHTPITTTTPSTTTTTTEVPSSTAATPAPVPPSTPPDAAPVTFVCGDLSLYQSGTALYSDGTTGYEPSCDTYVPPATIEPPAKVLRYCDYPGTAVYTDGSYSTTDPACAAMRAENPVTNPNPGGGYPYDPDEDRNGDGVVNGYERCGIRCGDAPTSGDIQTQHGCEQGYITGPVCEPYTG